MRQLEDEPEECAVSKTTEKPNAGLSEDAKWLKSGFMELEKNDGGVER